MTDYYQQFETAEKYFIKSFYFIGCIKKKVSHEFEYFIVIRNQMKREINRIRLTFKLGFSEEFSPLAICLSCNSYLDTIIIIIAQKKTTNFTIRQSHVQTLRLFGDLFHILSQMNL